MALQVARRLLELSRPVILLATHGQKVQDQCMGLLRTLRYKVDPIEPYQEEFIATI